MKTALALRHVPFEDLGSFDKTLRDHGYEIAYHDIGVAPLASLDLDKPDLAIILGGPVGVYETEAYPFLDHEMRGISGRLGLGKPTLGICLGAQLMAAALGARVAPTGHKEIGFSPLTLTPAGAAGPLRHLDGVSVLHWHGDAFEIPDGADNLGSTPLCATQGFALGDNILGLQFHPEADAEGGMEPWLIGHAAELSSAGIDLRLLRSDAIVHGTALRDAGRAMLDEWLRNLR